MLRLGIDERDELEEEFTGICEGLPFIIRDDIASAYGREYRIELNEDGIPIVTSLEIARSKANSLFQPRGTCRVC